MYEPNLANPTTTEDFLALAFNEAKRGGSDAKAQAYGLMAIAAALREGPRKPPTTGRPRGRRGLPPYDPARHD
jgi:hypothetical protein